MNNIFLRMPYFNLIQLMATVLICILNKGDLKYFECVSLQLSGREMFFFNPDLAANDLMDDGDEAFDSYAREEEEDDGEVQVSFPFYKLFQSSFEVCPCEINVGDTSSNVKHFAMD